MATFWRVFVYALLLVLGAMLIWASFPLGAAGETTVYQYSAVELDEENGTVTGRTVTDGSEFSRWDELLIDDDVACLSGNDRLCGFEYREYDRGYVRGGEDYEFVFLNGTFYDLPNEDERYEIDQLETASLSDVFRRTGAPEMYLTDTERTVIEEGPTTTTNRLHNEDRIVRYGGDYYSLYVHGSYEDGSCWGSISGDFCDEAASIANPNTHESLVRFMGSVGAAVGGFGLLVTGFKLRRSRNS